MSCRSYHNDKLLKRCVPSFTVNLRSEFVFWILRYQLAAFNYNMATRRKTKMLLQLRPQGCFDCGYVKFCPKIPLPFLCIKRPVFYTNLSQICQLFCMSELGTFQWLPNRIDRKMSVRCCTRAAHWQIYIRSIYYTVDYRYTHPSRASHVTSACWKGTGTDSI